MNFGILVFVLGWISLAEGVLLLIPALVSFLYEEPTAPFLIAAGIGFVISAVCLSVRGKKRSFGLKESFIITALGWLFLSLLGAVPFVLSGAISNPVDAFFETVSGFTTTGASILTEVESLPRGVLFWRSLTHWIGGMGVLVLVLALMPRSSGSMTNLMKAESPGPQVEKLVPKLRDSALILYGIYLGLTLLQIVLLRLTRMSWFDTLTLSLGTAGTGGFGIRNDSVGSYTALQQNIITAFMFLFGVNFNFYFYLLLRRWRRAFGMLEVRTYAGIFLGASLLMAWNVRELFDGFGPALQQTLFQAASVMSSTGYATTDYDLWPAFSRTIIALLMFGGACAGSTGGGFKIARGILLARGARSRIGRVLSPRKMRLIRVDGKTVDKETVDNTNAYLAVYAMVFIFSVLLVSLDGYDLTTNFTAVLSALNNIGPGLSLVGPAQNFALFSPGVKLLLSFDMLAGRLELLPVLALFTRDAWKR